MSIHRLAVVAVAFGLSGLSALAQEIPSGEQISNWTAPPYWMPSTAALPEKQEKESVTIPLNNIVGSSAETRLSPEAVEAVPTPPLAFTGITPCRVADTRGNGFAGQYGPPQLTPAGRTITIINTCGIPAAAQAVSFNFSAVNVPGAGFLVAYPAGGTFPPVATMTYNQNTPNLSNAAVVPLGTGGAIIVVAAVVSIDLVIDVNGYYAPQTVVNTVNGLSGAVTLSAGTNVTITPAGNTLTIASTAGGASSGWSLTGNSGTTAGTNFLGTTDNQALELKVNGQRAFRLEPTAFAPSAPNVIGGSSSNSVGPLYAQTICGGGDSIGPNRVFDAYGTVGGGAKNQAGSNDASFLETDATVSGGFNNTASGRGATVPGGWLNTAQGKYSFAGGYRAKARNDGSFVWADSNDFDFDPPVALGFANSFHVRATGGFFFVSGIDPTTTGVVLNPGSGSWSSLSDRAGKENFQIVDSHEILARLVSVPIQTWNYKTQAPSIRHIGSTAQDFRTAFEVGEDDRHISAVDADGVALAAIQALYEIVKEKDGEIEALKARLSKLEASTK